MGGAAMQTDTSRRRPSTPLDDGPMGIALYRVFRGMGDGSAAIDRTRTLRKRRAGRGGAIREQKPHGSLVQFAGSRDRSMVNAP